jgi:transposase
LQLVKSDGRRTSPASKRDLAATQIRPFTRTPLDGKEGGRLSDYIGARVLMSSLPKAKWLLADRGYDADWFRNGLKDMKIEPCIPSRKLRKQIIPHDKIRYKARHKIENMFGKLKDWRRIATRYDRCPELFLSAIAVAAIVLFCL